MPRILMNKKWSFSLFWLNTSTFLHLFTVKSLPFPFKLVIWHVQFVKKYVSQKKWENFGINYGYLFHLHLYLLRLYILRIVEQKKSVSSNFILADFINAYHYNSYQIEISISNIVAKMCFTKSNYFMKGYHWYIIVKMMKQVL